MVFIGQTAIIAIIIGLFWLITRRRTNLARTPAKYWCRSNVWLLRVLTGVRTIVTGAENIPPGGCIIASKHQSDWDVFAVFPYTGRPAYIIKQELMNLPFLAGPPARSTASRSIAAAAPMPFPK
ncbi:1-acyl-sn-glycerol-3-phosphate acyltransferase [Devosia sp. A8/3-2]|nr:1-acyl-sn-glycerol-3-phosphate acyltransferase [Devosia sp. A8/3-2]